MFFRFKPQFECDRQEASDRANRLNRLATDRRSIVDETDSVRVTIWYFDGHWLATAVYDENGDMVELSAGEVYKTFKDDLVPEGKREVDPLAV